MWRTSCAPSSVRITGNFDTHQKRQHVYARLTDPQWLIQALDYPAPATSDGEHFSVRGDVGIGPVRGAIEIHFQISDRRENERAVYRGWGSGLGSRLTLEASFRLADGQLGGTHVEWVGAADIDGQVASLASNLFQPLSERNFQHLKRSLDALMLP